MVNVNREERSAMVEQFKMKEWLSAHYRDVSFVILNGSASDELLPGAQPREPASPNHQPAHLYCIPLKKSRLSRPFGFYKDRIEFSKRVG